MVKSIMDTVARNKAGNKPLLPYLAKINAVKNVADLQSLMIEMASKGGVGFFGVGVGTDAKDSSRNVVYIGPGSLGLPDRDYYLSNDEAMLKIRTAYKTHLEKMLQLAGIEKPTENAAKAVSSADNADETSSNSFNGSGAKN